MCSPGKRSAPGTLQRPGCPRLWASGGPGCGSIADYVADKTQGRWAQASAGTTWLGSVAWQRPGCGRWPYPGLQTEHPILSPTLPLGRVYDEAARRTLAKTRCAGRVPAAAMDGRGSEYAHGCATERPGHTRCGAAPSEDGTPARWTHRSVMRRCCSSRPPLPGV